MLSATYLNFITLTQIQIKKYKVDLEADKEKATQICPYIATKRTDTSIENEIRQIQARVEQEEQVHGNEKEIIETYEEKRRTYDKVQQEVRQLKNYLQRLDEVSQYYCKMGI